MPQKPDKFGIKFWLTADSSSIYLVNGYPYLGKDESRPVNQPLSESVVLRLMEPYVGKGRNVTTDRYFTSVSLAQQLTEKRTSLVGTMNDRRKELPPSTRNLSMDLHSYKVLMNMNLT